MRLFRLGNGNYAIDADGVYTEGSLEIVRDFAKERFDIDELEFQKGLKALRTSGHNCASFGLAGTFIVTLNANRTRDVLAHCKVIRELRADVRLARELSLNSLESYELAERLATMERLLDMDVLIAVLESTEFPYVA